MPAVDWAAIATAAVGIVGVAATYFQSMAARKAASEDLKKSLDATAGNLATSIRAEDRRALQAEKQRVYSEFQGSLDDVFVAAVHLDDRVTGKADLNNALTVMYKATAAVKLVATEELGELANATAQAMANETGTARAGTDAFDRDNKIHENRQRLYKLMREDLGVDTPQEAEPSAVSSQQGGSLPSSGVPAGAALLPGHSGPESPQRLPAA
jgi:hypothetical protein